MTALDPGPGRRPAGEPTHPTPSRPVGPSTPPPLPTPAPGPPPAPKHGHLPTGYSDPRAAHSATDQAARESVPAVAGVGLPKLIAAISLLTSRAYAMCRQQWDPATGPQQCDPFDVADVDMRMAAVAADLHSALSGLDGLRTLTRPAPGHANTRAPVLVSRGSDDVPPRVVAGASSPVVELGKEPTPGSAAANGSAACESAGSVVDPRAGASSGPGRRALSRPAKRTAGTGFTAGVAPMAASFVLPTTKKFLMPGTAEIAAGINEALARRGS